MYSGTGRSGTSTNQTLGSGNGLSLYRICNASTFYRSDERIKNIVDISDNEALEILRQIQLKKAECKDLTNWNDIWIYCATN